MMKKYILKISFIFLFLMMVLNGFTQPPPPPSGAGHGASGNQTGGSAPIGSGLVVLLSLGAAYGGKKVFNGLTSYPEVDK